MDSLATRPSLSLSLARSNWEHGLRPPVRFIIIYTYIYGPRTILGLDGYAYGPHLPFSKPRFPSRFSLL